MSTRGINVGNGTKGRSVRRSFRSLAARAHGRGVRRSGSGSSRRGWSSPIFVVQAASANFGLCEERSGGYDAL